MWLEKAAGQTCSVCDYAVCSVVPQTECWLFVCEQRMRWVGSVFLHFLCSLCVVLCTGSVWRRGSSVPLALSVSLQSWRLSGELFSMVIPVVRILCPGWEDGSSTSSSWCSPSVLGPVSTVILIQLSFETSPQSLWWVEGGGGASRSLSAVHIKDNSFSSSQAMMLSDFCSQTHLQLHLCFPSLEMEK